MSEAMGDSQSCMYSIFSYVLSSTDKQHQKNLLFHILWHGTPWDIADNLVTKDDETKKYVGKFYHPTQNNTILNMFKFYSFPFNIDFWTMFHYLSVTHNE